MDGNYYASNQDCTWVFTDVRRVLLLRVVEMGLHNPHQTCLRDYIELPNGERLCNFNNHGCYIFVKETANVTLCDNICGNEHTNQVTQLHGHQWPPIIKFYSDQNHSDTGFVLTFYTNPCSNARIVNQRTEPTSLTTTTTTTTTSTVNVPSNSNQHTTKSYSTGIIVASVAGGVVGFILCLLLCRFIYYGRLGRKKRVRRVNSTTPNPLTYEYALNVTPAEPAKENHYGMVENEIYKQVTSGNVLPNDTEARYELIAT
uniref:CUB domain-containing protein n=2 Tax=Ciona intestinalis TaxID=7719 RepID=F7BGQ3_CIOIN